MSAPEGVRRLRRMTRAEALLVAGVVIAAASYVVLWRMGPYPVTGEIPPGVDADSRFASHYRQFIGGRILDTYAGVYPNTAYAVRAAWNGGRGLLWNPLQNCGQPYFGMLHTALLYPPQTFSLLLGADAALRVVPFFNLVVAGMFAYLLCRQLGAGTVGSVCGAVAFELGNATMEALGQDPHVSGSYVWLPAAFLFCERILAGPSTRDVAGLALALTLDLLAGFPQTTTYIYQLLALRMAWELASRGPSRSLRGLVAVGIALGLAPLLAAVQLLPAFEVARESVRNVSLPSQAMSGEFGFLEWRDYLLAIRLRATIHQPLVLVPLMLAAAAVLGPASRRRALFYLAAGVACFVLGLGPVTPLFGWYTTLPGGSLFRYPVRFMWLAGFCLAPLVALGVDTVLAPAPAGRARLATILAVMVAVVVGFGWLAPDGLWSVELALAAGMLAAAAAAMRVPRVRAWAGAVLVAGVLANLVAVPLGAWRYLVISGRPFLFAYEPTFARLRARMTAQDRAYLSFGSPYGSKFGLMPKTASLFEVPTLTDYEPLVTRRYAEFVARLRTGGELKSVFQAYVAGEATPGFNRRLLNLAAARYVLAEATVDHMDTVLRPPPPLLAEEDGARLYENPQALPRARYVPRVEVVEDPAALLQRLAAGDDDPRQVALVESPPASGFAGVDGNTAAGTAEFLRDDPEHLLLRVKAPAAGFLVLADQYFPGWQVRVNGELRPIVRANYVFRLVEVPAGESAVEFRYAPVSVRLGALVSGLTALGIVAALAVPGVRARRRARPAASDATARLKA